jgi:hypothetical protein
MDICGRRVARSEPSANLPLPPDAGTLYHDS